VGDAVAANNLKAKIEELVQKGAGE